MTREKAIKHLKEESKKRFGDVYEFPFLEDEYQGSHSVITIKCKKCGNVFTKIVCDHITSKNGGCECYREYTSLKANDVLEKLKKLYGDKFTFFIDTDKKYIREEKIKFICNKHKTEYKVMYNTLIKGKFECPICKREEKLERFREKIKTLCDDKFDFNVTKIVNEYKGIIFTCKRCGIKFKRSIIALKKDKLCHNCEYDPVITKEKTEDFIKRAREIFGDKYDYSNALYSGNCDTVVNVICHELDEFGEEHGPFPVTIHSHLGMKSGCPKCANKHQYTTEEYIRKAKLKHHDRYLYDGVEYTTSHATIYPICKIHGPFKTKAYQHLQGEGCPECNGSRGEKILGALLKQQCIEYKAYFREFEWIGTQSIDFYLPEYNIGIEYQGRQHFMWVKFYHKTYEDFLHQQELDDAKRKLCEEHGIKLIYYADYEYDFPYKVITSQEELLEEIFRHDSCNKQN